MSVRDDVNVILDVFAAADGGVNFAKLLFALDDIEKRSLGDTSEAASSIQLLEIVSRFRRLVDVLTK
ncbi:hypothetical protein [Pseudomonas phage COT4]|uniref:Uncharacterized protein n=1 Tax=Pseudomonas phage M5.1 TaxID=2873460 RepID=A0AAE9BNX7_9CAUD|nr:hypothetical protein QGX13_gp174 [Pseudomonas phage M5.1]UAV89650.1 hypothetical protein M51_54 [Pseudomonas phage M5.1]UGL61249.1 hypothetical protein [Pseudomonas phage COT4]